MQSPQTDRGHWLANTAWRALAHPASLDCPPSCLKLLGEAAFGLPLCCEAAATVESIAIDILEADEAGDE